MNAVKPAPHDKTKAFFRVAYVLFILLAIYYSVKGETGNAASNLGIGLIFDPFAPAKWQERKGWQKAWLLVHVTAVFALFAVTIFLK
jgi:succinate dehydrogenase hydrophobic anchor subunit